MAEPVVCLRFNRYYGLTDIGLTRVHCKYIVYTMKELVHTISV